jgi:hypothetical protein
MVSILRSKTHTCSLFGQSYDPEYELTFHFLVLLVDVAM